jgi:hypothetical protein
VSKWAPGVKSALRQDCKNNLKEELSAVLDGTQDHTVDIEQRRAFLQASSNAIMTSSILRKAEEGAEKAAFKSRREVLAERTKILQGISLPEMSKDNLFTVLYHFGTVDKRSVDQIFTCLVDSTPSPRAGGAADPDRGLQFEEFWCMFRAVHPTPAFDTKCGLKIAEASTGSWLDLETPRKLVYQVFAEPEVPGRSTELFASDVVATLRRLLCTSVLHDVDHSSAAHSRSSDSPTNKQASQTSTHHIAPISHLALKLLGECLHMWFTSQEQRKRHNHMGTCDQAAIDKFAGKWPNAFVCVFRLLFPLASHGREFIQADMELAQKCLFHRRGEIHAKMNTLINKNQREMLRSIWEGFVQPQLAERARKLSRMVTTRDLHSIKRPRRSTEDSADLQS